jgi:hypothetical protein
MRSVEARAGFARAEEQAMWLRSVEARALFSAGVAASQVNA